MKGSKMLYDIYLNEPLKENADNKIRTLLAKLSCENADYLLSGLYPVIICRYATEEEKDFYLSFAKWNDLDITSKQIKESVFESFDLEIKRNEQEDTHLMNKPTIKEKLELGLAFLQDKEENESIFLNASDNILSAIRKRKEMMTLKFKPSSIYMTFLLWMIFSCGIVLLFDLLLMDLLFICSCAFITLISISLCGDYWIYKRTLQNYFSESGEKMFWDTLEINNKAKNDAIHSVEDKVDNLSARSKLTVLPVSKRDVNSIEELLEKFDELTLNEILATL